MVQAGRLCSVQTTIYRMEGKQAVRRVRKISNAYIFSGRDLRTEAPPASATSRFLPVGQVSQNSHISGPTPRAKTEMRHLFRFVCTFAPVPPLIFMKAQRDETRSCTIARVRRRYGATRRGCADLRRRLRQSAAAYRDPRGRLPRHSNQCFL